MQDSNLRLLAPESGAIGQGSENARRSDVPADGETRLSLASPPTRPKRADDCDVSPLPAAPVVRPVDLVRAADAALLAGDVFGARSLLAAVVAALEVDDGKAGTGHERGERV